MPNNENTRKDGDNIVSWSDTLVVGIEMIDNQHKHLVELTNELYRACTLGGNTLDTVFKATMRRVADYVRFHFATEEKLFNMINYPDYLEHKNEHYILVYKVIKALKEYERDKNFVPSDFVQFLKDWIVNHIAKSDQKYAVFYRKKKMLV